MKKWINHPCIIEDKNTHKLSLKIFHYFYCEMNLPKYQEGFKFKNDGNLSGEEIMFQRADWESLQDAISHSASSSNDRNNGEYIASVKRSITQKMPFFQKIYNWWNKIDPVIETFNKIKNSTGKIGSDLKDTINNLDKLIVRAERSNQLALIEKLKEVKNVVACEILLSNKGYDKFVTEDKIIEFFKRCNRGVRIDYIRNYSTLIPFSVLEKKEELDKLGVFDNYVVMHYDPNTVVFEETEEDRRAEAKRDPILFGLIKGSRKLYFVDDWITDDDDLTLDELNIVVENATSRIAKLNVQVEETISSMAEMLKDFHPVDNSGEFLE